MAEHVERATAVGQHDLLEELFEVADIVVEIVDIAARRIAQHAAGIALAAPVDERRAKAAGAEIADRLEIFLDAFVAAGQDDDGALERPAGGAEAGIAQPATRRAPS